MELYSFQQEAIDKFVANAQQYPHVLIGDDMGLGKTVTAIALDRRRRLAQLSDKQLGWIGRYRRQTLVVTKKSVMSSWEDHFAEWAPQAEVCSLIRFSRDELADQALNQKADVFILNWESLRLLPKLCQVPWLHIIGDEVHAIKNRKAQVTVAFKAIKALHKTDMSGTWADNSPEDGWSILNHLYPRVWSSYWTYYNRHIIHRSKINPKTGQTYREVVGVAEADVLQEAMAPFYIRRLTDEVIDLPEQVYNTIGVRLHPKQQRAYDTMRRDMLSWVGEHEDQPIAAPVVIAKLIRLQQFAIAYGEIRPVERMAWREVAEASVEKLRANGIKVMKRPVKDTEDAHSYWAWQKEIVNKLFLTDPSAKLDAVMEWLDDIPSNESVVVFSQSKMATNLLAERLKKIGETYGVLTGDVSSDVARKNLVDDFQAGKFRVFCGTIKAGGEGITLTRASRMAFVDRDWSPSKNRQAEKRIHRIGQSKTCFYTDFVGIGTLDAGRNQRIQLKWEWIKKILGDKPNKEENGS